MLILDVNKYSFEHNILISGIPKSKCSSSLWWCSPSKGDGSFGVIVRMSNPILKASIVNIS